MRVAALLLAIALLGACAGPQELIADAPEVDPQIELPEYKPAFPGLRVELRTTVTKGVVKKAEGADGVVVAAPISVERVAVTAGDQRRSLRVVAVDPLAFRSVAPQSTREADYVWTALLGGRVVLTPDAARSLNFGTSGHVVFRRNEISVGAFADNGTPNLGDVMISEGLGRSTEVPESHELIVGTKEGADLGAIAARLRKTIVGIERVQRLQPRAPEPAETPDAVGTAEGELIGSMNFRILKDGFIDPDPAWVSANIVHGEVPILGDVTCHRVLFPQLFAALSEIETEGLSREIDVKQYGGCYVPRFISRDPRRGLSMHAFGLAVDLNVSQNYYGTRGHMDEQIVAIFEKWGFAWGGRWSEPDPMHFELARLVQV
jgi:hypothetical protein